MAEQGDPNTTVQQRIVNGFWAYSGSQSELGRAFARRMHMHPTDSAAMIEILRAEDRGDPLTPARLSARVGLTSGATSILLNRLEEAGHVIRQRGHTDRRMVTLHSTESVHAAGSEFMASVRDRLNAVMEEYTPEQLQLIDRFVAAFEAAMDTGAAAT